LIVPAINTLVRANFDGSKRATAYGTLFGVAAAGAAFGPLIGGWVTTEYSWRYAFIGEAIIVVIVLLSSGLIADAPRVVPKPKLDQIGVVLSVSGMGMFVLGVLQTTTRGWTDPVVLGLIFGGLIVLGIFVRRAVGRERLRLPTLVRPSIFKSRGISVGLPVLSTQLFAQAGLLFLVPVFTQSVLGFDAFETGLTLLPLSIGVLVTSVSTPPLGRKIYPKYIIQTGLVLLFVGGFVLAKSLDGATSGSDLRLGLIIGGVAIGLVAGQLPNLILSSVDQDHASEASGLQGTFQNLGMALGTAVIGTVILTVALSSLQSQVEASTVFPDEIKGTLTTELEQSIDEMARAELGEYIDTLDSDQQAEAERIFETGTLRGFQGAIVVGGVVALLGGLLAFRLPKVKLRDDASIENTVKEIVRNPTVAKFHLEMEDFSTSTDSGP
jgi:MFS family permease